LKIGRWRCGLGLLACQFAPRHTCDGADCAFEPACALQSSGRRRGPHGRGDKPATAALLQQSNDLTCIARPPSLTDGIVAYRIADGGEDMPARKCELPEQDVWEIVNFIRTQRLDVAYSPSLKRCANDRPPSPQGALRRYELDACPYRRQPGWCSPMGAASKGQGEARRSRPLRRRRSSAMLDRAPSCGFSPARPSTDPREPQSLLP
jgi:hypothetical protein